MTWLLPIFLSLAGAEARTARLDVLCGAYLTHAAEAGAPLTAGEAEREIRIPLELAAASARGHGVGAGVMARLRNLLRPGLEASSEHVSFREEDLALFPTPLERRDAAHAIQYHLETMIDDVLQTPAAATPIAHVLRGRDAVLGFLKTVRATAAGLEQKLAAATAAHVTGLRDEKARLAGNLPRHLGRAARVGVMAAYGTLVGGATLGLAAHAPHAAPAAAFVLGVGGWVLRSKLFGAALELHRRATAWRENRRLDRAIRAVDAREEKIIRADFELEAIDELIALVSADVPTSRFAFSTHTVDLPIPLAAQYLDDRYLAADVVLEAIFAGHVPFIGGRRARLTHALYFEDGVPVLITLLQEQLQPGIVDLYVTDDL